MDTASCQQVVSGLELMVGKKGSDTRAYILWLPLCYHRLPVAQVRRRRRRRWAGKHLT